jgi:hypothetical protein
MPTTTTKSVMTTILGTHHPHQPLSKSRPSDTVASDHAAEHGHPITRSPASTTTSKEGQAWRLP